MKFSIKEIPGTKGKERGVFANYPIAEASIICDFHGTRIKSVNHPSWDKDDAAMQVGPGIYLTASNLYDDAIRHSCNPNAAVKIEKGLVQLVALKDIPAMEEITFDYSITTDDPNWSKECVCGYSSCRKILRSYPFLPKRVTALYRAQMLVPRYLIGK